MTTVNFRNFVPVSRFCCPPEDSLADTVAGSRSALMRWALEHALPSVRDHVLSVAAAGVAPPGSVAGPRPVPVARPRRRGRPPSSDNARRLVHLQAQARAILEEAPEMDEEALRRLLVAAHAAALGISADCHRSPNNPPLWSLKTPHLDS